MNKLLFVLCFAAICFAEAPVDSIRPVFEWGTVDTIYTGTTYDTLIGADSAEFKVDGKNYWIPDQAWNYYLKCSAITGDGTDSIAINFRLDSYMKVSGSYVWVDSTYFQSVTSADPFEAKIPIAAKLFGQAYKIKAVSSASHSASDATRFNRAWIVKRRPITINKEWSTK